MTRRRAIRESLPIIVDWLIDDLDLGDDDLDLAANDLDLADGESLDLNDDDDAAWVWACADDGEAWCDCAPWIDDELRSALWWSIYKNLNRRHRMH